jgi:hypothetical protein
LDIDQIAIIGARHDLTSWSTYYKGLVEHYRNLGFEFDPGSRGADFFEEVMDARTKFMRPDGSFDDYALDEALRLILERYQ